MHTPVRDVETAPIVDTLADGRGVVRAVGKTVFVQGALTGETVRFVRRRKHRNYDDAELVEVVDASPERVEPRCVAFHRCGGCALQHLASAQQLVLKQTVLQDNLRRIGGIEPARLLAPVCGAVWAYRRRARLAVKYVPRKGRVLVGFRERHTSFVADMRQCETLHRDAARELGALSALIGDLSLRERIPQIEVAVGDNATAFVFRMLDPPSSADLDRLRAYQESRGVQVFLQTGGVDTVRPLPGAPEPAELYYRIPRFDVTIRFRPTDFIQVHAQVNCAMIEQAVELLAPRADSRVLDLFCGLGNFTLPLARRAGHVTGVDASASMLRRAQRNAELARLANVSFQQADLSRPAPAGVRVWGRYDRVLLDPPRTGARETLDAVGRAGAQRIVYVSCHPGTLARDARRLVEDFDYELSAAGIIDMFPHTSHVESMALFKRRR